jgi:hypothetical protein
MLHNLMLHCVLLPLVTGNAKHKAQHSTQCCTFTPSHMHQTKQHALWLPCQVVVSVLACPNMPQEPILAIGPVDEAERQSYEARRRRYGYPSGRECGWDGKPPWEGPATTPESISKPTLQEDPSDGVGCLFVAVRDQGAYQLPLFGKGFAASTSHVASHSCKTSPYQHKFCQFVSLFFP